MMRSVGANGVRLGSDGRLEVVRCAPPEDPAALRATVDRLRAAAGPGVVEVLSCVDDGDGVVVVLAFAGHAVEGPLRGDALAPIAASVASHLSDLHLRGVAHGAVAAEHVLVDAAGGVRLCGLRGGDPADDVVALGRLVDRLLDAEDRSEAAAALRAVVARCTTEDPSARPTMAAIAASLATASPARRAVRVEAPPRERSSRPLVAGAALLGAITVGVVATVGRADPQPAARTTTTTSITTTTTIAAPPAPPRRFEHRGVTWELGTERDQLLLGDWNCDGVDTPALLTAADHALYVIDEWPTGEALAARHVRTISNATRAEVERGPSCDRIVVETDDGEELTPALGA